MTTAAQLIQRALLDLGVVMGGDQPTADEMSDGLVYLNDLIQSLANEGLMIEKQTIDGYTLVASTQSLTIGSGATWNTNRPIHTSIIYYTLNGYDYPLTLINADQYTAIADKTSAGQPDRYWISYNDTPDVGAGNLWSTLYLYPVPSSGRLTAVSSSPITEMANSSTEFNLPYGYERMLRLNLAVEMMPMYEKNNPTLIALAEKAKRDIKRQNAANRPVISPLGLPYGNRYKGNIITGT